MIVSILELESVKKAAADRWPRTARANAKISAHPNQLPKAKRRSSLATPMQPPAQTELERLEDQRRLLKEREKLLLTMCDRLEERIREVRARVNESAEAEESIVVEPAA